MQIRTKRIYERPAATDGERILVDRLWPRGVSRSDAKLDEWLKELAPSDALRKWFAHKSERWREFQQRYSAEFKDPEKQELIRRLRLAARKATVTLVYAAKDTEHNNARALAAFIAGERRGSK
jgi:uncharacterized protein YeaO (DUF488 family)